MITLMGSGGPVVNSGATITLSKPGGAAVGDCLLAIIRSTDNVSPYNAGLSGAPSGWTQVDSRITSSGGEPLLVSAVYLHFVGAAEPTDYAWTITETGTNFGAGLLVWLRGVYSPDPVVIEASSADTTNDTTASFPEIISTSDTVLSVVLWAAISSSSITAMGVSGYTRPISGSRVAAAYKPIAAAGTIPGGSLTLDSATLASHAYHLALRSSPALSAILHHRRQQGES